MSAAPTVERWFEERGIERTEVRIEPRACWLDPAGDGASVLYVGAGEVVVHSHGRLGSRGAGGWIVTRPHELIAVRAIDTRAWVRAVRVSRSRLGLLARAADTPGEPRGAPPVDAAAVRWAEWLAAAIADRPSAPSIEPGPVRRAREKIVRELDAGPKLDALAREAGLSKYHLLRLFRSHHGVPPRVYLLCRRIGIARDLLAGGTRVGDVASETGFADQSHFSRSFRKLVGMSASEYARIARADSTPRSPWRRPGEGA